MSLIAFLEALRQRRLDVRLEQVTLRGLDEDKITKLSEEYGLEGEVHGDGTIIIKNVQR